MVLWGSIAGITFALLRLGLAGSANTNAETRIGNRTVAEVVAASDLPSYSLICPLSHSVCFQQCYDPVLEDCVDDRIACPKGQVRCGNSGCYARGPGSEKECIQLGPTAKTAPILCQRGERVCGWRCYNPAAQACLDDGWICPLGQSMCGSYNCYDPTREHCIGPASYQIVCPLGEKLCGYSCYDPAVNVCFNDTAQGHSQSPTRRTEVLCNRGERACGRRCYDPNSEEVNGKGLRCTEAGALCPPGHEGCDRWKCFSPADGQTCHEDRSLKCDAGWEPCGDDGWECYDLEREDCFPEARNKICYKGRSPCDLDLCHWAHNETCYPSGTQPGYGSHVCPKELGVCGYKCFDPNLEFCHVGRGTRVVCGVGQRGCGNRCYDPAKQVCAGKREVLCKPGEDACGAMCFRPDRGLTCYDDRTLCRKGKLGCGCKCYNPKTYSCHKVPNGEWSWSD